MTAARHKFQEEWLSDPNLQPWLVKVSNDISRAYCRYCAIVLRAHKTDISNHGSTAKHMNNGKIAVESGTAANGPISVQIVFNDDDVNLEDAKDESLDIQSSQGVVGTQFIQQHGIKRQSGGGGPPIRRYICKRYRVEWESDPVLKDWVKAYKHDETKAYCRVCETPLRAHKHDLVLHAKSAKHTKQAACFDFSAENEANSNSSDSFEDCGGDIGGGSGDTSDEIIADSPIKIHQAHSSSSQQLHQLKLESVESILMNGSNVDQGNSVMVSLPSSVGTSGDEISERGDGSTGVFGSSKAIEEKMIKVSPRRGSKLMNRDPGGFRRRQTYINAADVVAAIENNEFTGYELLQIVKTAVPKL